MPIDQDLLAFLAAMEQRLFSAMEKRFDAMEKRSDAMEGRFDAMEKRSDAMEGRFDAMEKRSDAMEARFTQQIQALRQEMVERFTQTDQRFSNLDTEVRELHVVVEDIQDKIQLTAEGVTNVNEKLDRHREEVSQRFNDLESLMRDSDRAVATRVDRLEQQLKRAV